MKSLSLRKNADNGGWIGVDLDCTLAYYESGYCRQGKVGDPIPKMMERVKKWIKEGKTVKIFTARAASSKNVEPVKKWLKKHGLENLEITNKKDPDMIELWDDKVVQIIPNTGERVDGRG